MLLHCYCESSPFIISLSQDFVILFELFITRHQPHIIISYHNLSDMTKFMLDPQITAQDCLSDRVCLRLDRYGSKLMPGTIFDMEMGLVKHVQLCND